MSFDHLAPHYRWIEAVLAGRVLQRARVAHLAALDEAGHVLLVGEGPGRFLEALRRRRPDVRITVVDRSRAMLAAAAKRVPGDARTEFLRADIGAWRVPAEAFDAVVTACVLDCFPRRRVAGIVTRLARALRPAATWLHIDFAIPPAGWRRVRARAIHRLMYATFRRVTRIEAHEVTWPDPWLRAGGFALQSRREFSAGLLRAEHWARGATHDAVAGYSTRNSATLQLGSRVPV